MQGSSLVILSYKIKHNYNISGFLSNYKLLLQTIDVIWSNIKWIEKRQNHYVIKRGRGKVKKYYYVKRLIPIIPKSREFKRELRNTLLRNWSYASHYVDSAIKTGLFDYKLLEKELHQGQGEEEEIVKRRFVRVKETLYVYRDGKIKAI